MTKPLISIIITYYKKKNFILKTFKTIKKQTYKNYELIFVYDDKDLADLKYIKKCIAIFKNHKVIVNKKNYEQIKELFEDFMNDLIGGQNKKKIESLERKLINNMEENAYSELLKLKNQINRD